MEADLVGTVPESATPAAMGYAKQVSYRSNVKVIEILLYLCSKSVGHCLVSIDPEIRP